VYIIRAQRSSDNLPSYQTFSSSMTNAKLASDDNNIIFIIVAMTMTKIPEFSSK